MLAKNKKKGTYIFSLKGKNRAYQALMDRMCEGVIALNRDGTILYCNKQFAKIVGLSSQSILGSSLFEYLDELEQHALLQFLTPKAKKVRKEFNLKVKKRPAVSVIISSHEVKFNQNHVFSLIITDITDFKKTSRSLNIQLELTRIIEKGKSISDVFPALLSCLCTELDWSIGEMWQVDSENKVLRRVESWHEGGDKLRNFDAVCYKMSFKPGESVTGSVWKSGKSIWIEDTAEKQDLPRMKMATTLGLKSCVAVPIFFKEKIYGVMTFLGKKKREKDQELIEFISIVGKHIGEFLQEKNIETKFIKLSQYDPATGLINRSFLEKILDENLLHKYTSLIALFLFSVDQLNLISNVKGHIFVEHLLKEMLNRFKMEFNEKDYILARVGDKKFSIVAISLKSKNEVANCAKKILDLFKTSFLVESEEIMMTISMGVSLYPSDAKDSKSLLSFADLALSRARQHGGNNFKFSILSDAKLRIKRLKLETALYQAQSKNQFCLYYQPQVDIKTGLISGAEALIRWQHPEKGLLSPSSFIDLAEELGLIPAIGEWTLKEVCKQIKENKLQFPIAVNLSAQQLHPKYNLISYLKKLLSDFKFSPTLLEIEITESQLINEVKQNSILLNEIKKLGFMLAIDDFGTGYSSLSYLKNVPADTIKIDQIFIAKLPEDKVNVAIVRAIIDLFHVLGKKVLAEGVQTSAEYNFLKSVGCDRVQGFYCSQPLSSNKFKKLIDANKKLIK